MTIEAKLASTVLSEVQYWWLQTQGGRKSATISFSNTLSEGAQLHKLDRSGTREGQ